MICPLCGSTQTAYLAMDDGGGGYGEAVCEQWECFDCQATFDGDCIGEAVDGIFYDDQNDDDNDEFPEEAEFKDDAMSEWYAQFTAHDDEQ